MTRTPRILEYICSAYVLVTGEAERTELKYFEKEHVCQFEVTTYFKLAILNFYWLLCSVDLCANET